MEQKVVEEKGIEEKTMPTVIEQPKVIDSEPSESPQQQFKAVEATVEKPISSNSAKKK